MYQINILFFINFWPEICSVCHFCMKRALRKLDIVSLQSLFKSWLTNWRWHLPYLRHIRLKTNVEINTVWYGGIVINRKKLFLKHFRYILDNLIIEIRRFLWKCINLFLYGLRDRLLWRGGLVQNFAFEIRIKESRSSLQVVGLYLRKHRSNIILSITLWFQ